jgi:hypothetical protein
MKKYYFTFGFNHKHINGESLKDYYIVVYASDYITAVELMNTWLVDNTQNLVWTKNHEEKEFNKSLYPKGAYETIFEEQI